MTHSNRSWLDALRPAGGHEPKPAASTSALLAELTDLIGENLVAWGIERADVLFERPHDEGDRDPGYSEARVAEAVVLSALVSARTGRVDSELLVAEGDRAARAAVVRGMSVEVVVQGVQRTYANVARELSSLAEEKLPASERGVAIRQLMSDLFAGLDYLSSTLIARFAAEREQWLRTAAFARRDLVESVLSGASPGQAMSRKLGYDLSRHHLALLVWSEDQAEHTSQDLERVALTVLAAANCTSQLLVVAGPAKLWAWGSRARNGPLPDLPELPVTDGVYVAAGLLEAGTDGFRASHRQAAVVERLTRLAGRKPGLFAYEDLALVALAAENLDSAADFVRRELGPLSANDPANAELRQTLKAYLDHDKGVAAAASQLHVAKNTVLYRVRKAEQLLDRSVRDDRLRLHVALHLAEALGAAVLG